MLWTCLDTQYVRLNPLVAICEADFRFSLDYFAVEPRVRPFKSALRAVELRDCPFKPALSADEPRVRPCIHSRNALWGRLSPARQT